MENQKRVISTNMVNGIKVTVYSDQTASVSGHGIDIEGTSLPFTGTFNGQSITIDSNGSLSMTSGSIRANGVSFKDSKPKDFSESVTGSNNTDKAVNNVNNTYKVVGSNNNIKLLNPSSGLSITGSNNEISITLDKPSKVEVVGSNNTVFIKGSAKSISSVGSNNEYFFV